MTNATLSSWNDLIDLLISFEGFETKTAYDMYGIPTLGHGFALIILAQKNPAIWQIRSDINLRFGEAGMPLLNQAGLNVLLACAADLTAGKKNIRDLTPIGITITRQQARVLVESHVRELAAQVSSRLTNAWDTLGWAKRGGLLQWLYVRGIGALTQELQNEWRQGHFFKVADDIVKNSPKVIASRSKLAANLIAYGSFDRHGFYSVRPGDTLGSIAAHLRLTQQALLDANGALKVNPHKLSIGQELKLPVVA
ncbi:MAG: LysM peptidoglycan-binding domain-containing protein [Alphaproteobacteria bacterium]|nr:LysM peptidoglycan-binding domain-containing protein [Alphaproteobacteria bacterium]